MQKVIFNININFDDKLLPLITMFFLDFELKCLTTLENSTKNITTMSWKLDIRKNSKIVQCVLLSDYHLT